MSLWCSVDGVLNETWRMFLVLLDFFLKQFLLLLSLGAMLGEFLDMVRVCTDEMTTTHLFESSYRGKQGVKRSFRHVCHLTPCQSIVK